MTPTCSSCKTPLSHITGHAVIRLYRCGGCGEQQMLPGDPSAVETAAAPAAVVEAARPAPAKKGLLAKIFGG